MVCFESFTSRHDSAGAMTTPNIPQFLRLCAECPMSALCQAEGNRTATASNGAGIYLCRKGRSIYHQGNIGNQIHILREGWAFRFTMLPNGRRQILEFLLPGDPVLLPLLFVPRLPYTVNALTEITLCTFSLKDLSEQFRMSRAAARQIEVACATALVRAEARLAEINQRTSQERTAWLLLSLYHDLKRRGHGKDNTVPFPLNLSHIADALGITITHVSRTLGALKRDGMVSVAGDRLTVHVEQELAAIALLPYPAE